MKAQALIPYDPDNKEFWEHHWIISKLVDLLKIRGAKVDSGGKLRIILTMDDGKPTLFLQGEELEVVARLLKDSLGSMSEEDREIVEGILERVS